MSGESLHIAPARRGGFSLALMSEQCGLPWRPSARQKPCARIGKSLRAGRTTPPPCGAEAGLVVAHVTWWRRPVPERPLPLLILFVGAGPTLPDDDDMIALRRALELGFAVGLAVERRADVRTLLAEMRAVT